MEDPCIKISLVGLEEEVELTDSEQEGQEEEADTLGEAVEKAEGILVGVAVDPLMLDTISRMIVVTKRLSWSSDYHISDKLTYRSA